MNASNPVTGVFLFMLGGMAGAVFYLPLKKVKKWAWESYWFIYAVFGLLLVPWALAYVASPNLFSVLLASPHKEIIYCLVCGVLWGLGGLTWGLMIRYLGVGLGLAMGAGLTSVAGTLIPPMLRGRQTVIQMFTTTGGVISIMAALVSLGGIVCIGWAGKIKVTELSEAAKKKAVAEFDFRKGLMAAIFAGLMSSAMSFGLQGGPDIQKLALELPPVTSVTWAGMPVLVVVLFGGFLVNGGWCIFLNSRNNTSSDYIKRGTPITANLFFSGLAGTIWCSQFVCFKAGEPRMGSASYIGWAVLMAASILFSQVIGLFLGEWKGTSAKTKRFLATGLMLLVTSAVLAGYAGSLS